MRHVGDETGGREHLVTSVDADQKFGRADIPLNRAELNAFNLAGYWSQLARRVNLALYSASRIPFHHCHESLAPFVLRIIVRGGAELHHIGCRPPAPRRM